MANLELKEYIKERLLVLDPTLDLAEGAPAMVHVVDPVIAKLGVDPLSTDIRLFILSRLSAQFPELDITGAGNELADILVGPAQIMLTPFQRELAQVKTSLTLTNPELLSAEEIDALLANFFAARQEGGFASGTVRLYFSEARQVDIDGSIIATAAGGLQFFADEEFSKTPEQMALTVEDGLYVVDVDFIAVEEGEKYSIAANSMLSIDNVPGVLKVDNKLAFSGGVDVETTSGFISRVETAISERSMNTVAGITARLTEKISDIRGIQVIGFGDTEMDRDVLKGTATFDEEKLGLGPTFLTTSAVTGDDIDLSLDSYSGVAAPLNELKITAFDGSTWSTTPVEITNVIEFTTQSEVDQLSAGDVLTVGLIDYKVEEISGKDVTVDSFSIVSKSNTGAVEAEAKPGGAGASLLYTAKFKDPGLVGGGDTFLSMGAQAGDYLRVDGGVNDDPAHNFIYHLPEEQPGAWTGGPSGTSLGENGPGNRLTKYFKIGSVTATSLLLDANPHLSRVSSGHLSQGLGAKVTVSNVGAEGWTVEIVNTATFNFNSIPAAMPGDFITLEGIDGNGDYDSSVLQRQEWEIKEVKTAQKLILKRRVVLRTGAWANGTPAVGNTVTATNDSVIGTIAKIYFDASDRAVVLDLANNVAISTGITLVKIQGGAITGSIYADNSTIPTAYTSGYRVSWSIRRGKDNSGIHDIPGYSKEDFMLGPGSMAAPNASGAIKYAIVRFASAIASPETYTGFLPVGALAGVSARKQLTLADVNGTASISISDAPFPVTSVGTLENIVVVNEGETVHIGGCTDAYIYHVDLVSNELEFINDDQTKPLGGARDESPLAPTEIEMDEASYPDLATSTIGDKARLQAKGFYGKTFSNTSALVILDGDDAGVFRIASHDPSVGGNKGEVRLDTELSATLAATRYYVTDDIEMYLPSPKIYKVRAGTKLQTTVASNEVKDLTKDFSNAGPLPVIGSGDVEAASVASTDFIQIKEGSDTGVYPIISKIGATGLELSTTMLATAEDVDYCIYTPLDPIDLPFTRITNVEKVVGGLKVPYAHPVDVRCTAMTNDQQGLKLSGSDMTIVGTGCVKIYGQTDVESAFGVKVGDVVKITTGDSVGEYPISHITTEYEMGSDVVKSTLLYLQYDKGFKIQDPILTLHYKNLAGGTISVGDTIRWLVTTGAGAGMSIAGFDAGVVVSVTSPVNNTGTLTVKWSLPVPVLGFPVTGMEVVGSNPQITFNPTLEDKDELTAWPTPDPVSYEVGGPSHGVIRAYFLDPTMYEVTTSAASFKTGDNKEYLPDLDFRHELIKKHDSDADGEIYTGVVDVKVTYANANERLVVGEIVENFLADNSFYKMGKVLAVEGENNSAPFTEYIRLGLWVGYDGSNNAPLTTFTDHATPLSAAPDLKGITSGFSPAVVAGSVIQLTEMGSYLYAAGEGHYGAFVSATDFSKEGVKAGHRLYPKTIPITGTTDLTNGASIGGASLTLSIDNGPTQTVVFSGTNPIALTEEGIPGGIVQQINTELNAHGVTAAVKTIGAAVYLELYSAKSLTLGSSTAVNDLLFGENTDGTTNALVVANAGPFKISKVVDPSTVSGATGFWPGSSALNASAKYHVLELTKELDVALGIPEKSGVAAQKDIADRMQPVTYSIVSLATQRIGPKDMSSNTQDGLYYYDVEVRSKSFGDHFNLGDNTALTSSGHSSYGYYLTSKNDVLTFSTLEQVEFHTTPFVLDPAFDDELENLEAVAGQDLKITYSTAEAVETAQDLMVLNSERIINNNPLARHSQPAYVRATISYAGGSSVTVVKEDLVSLINGTAPSADLEVSDIYALLTKRGATFVASPIEILAVRHKVDRSIDTVRSKDRLAVNRISHLIAEEDHITLTGSD